MLHKSHLFIPMAALSLMSMTGCHKHHSLHQFHKKVPDKIIKHIAREIDLNDSQKEKLQSIAAEIQEKHKEMKPGHGNQFASLTDMLRQDTLNIQGLNAMFDEKQNAMDSMRPFMLEKLTEFHAMLTPEQRNKLADKMIDFHSQHGKKD